MENKEFLNWMDSLVNAGGNKEKSADQTAKKQPDARETTPAIVHKRVEYDSGSVYEGGWANGKMNGKGRYTWADGAVYEGDFVDGNFEGFGKRAYASGGIYEGQWKADRRSGQGKYTFSGGDVYEGQWADDRKNGRGTYTSAKGWVYVGDFLEDEMTGCGTVTFADGETYVGEWRGGKRNGHGKYTSSDGILYYDGGWKDNQKHGHAVYTEEGARPNPHTDYSVFKVEGNFENGRKVGRHREFLEGFVWLNSGEGYRKCQNPGEPFDCFYRDGKRVAGLKATEVTARYTVDEAERVANEAEARWRRKAREEERRNAYAATPYAPMECRELDTAAGHYDGTFADGVRCGYGECAYDNGDRYRGTWKAQLADGVGRYDFADGAWYFGEFKAGQMNGYGVYFDGNYHVGRFENGGCMTEESVFRSFSSHFRWLTNSSGQRVFADPNGGTIGIINGDTYRFFSYVENGQMYYAYLSTGDTPILITGKGGDGQLINDPNGAVVYVDSSVVRGPLKDSKLNGRAMAAYVQGDRFDCEYRNSLPTVVYHHWDARGREVRD